MEDRVTSLHIRIMVTTRRLKEQDNDDIDQLDIPVRLTRSNRRELMGRGDTQKEQLDDDDEVDLAPMLKAALDKLWKRPYECRIFTLQLLQALAQLDDQSLNSMRARLHCHACAPLSGCNTSPCFVCCVTPQ